MNARSLKLAAIAALAPALFCVPQAKAANNTAAIVGGIIAGAAIGAAVSGAIKHPQPVYHPKPPPPPPPWQQTYQPAAGIWCYPAQRACYKDSGAYAPGWTARIYGG